MPLNQRSATSGKRTGNELSDTVIGTEAVDEADLVRRLKQGQQWACNTLVTLYQKLLLKLAYGITLDQEESKEIVQDVLVTAIRKIETFRGESALWPWLRRIAVNACLNWKRKWKRRFRWHHISLENADYGLTHDRDEKPDTPEARLQEKQAWSNIIGAAGSLPENIRTPFILCVFEGLSYQEIATILKINKGTVSSRIYRARQLIVKSMEAGKTNKKGK